MSTLGLASVAMTPTLASIPGGNNKDSIRARIPISTDWDVIVVGGGPSGCAAAAAAARDGARTLLIEGTGGFGRHGTSGLLKPGCPFTDGNRIIYKGIAEKVFMESRKGVPHVRYNDWVPINSEYLKVVYDDLVTQARCTRALLYDHGCCRNETRRSGGRNHCGQQGRPYSLQG